MAVELNNTIYDMSEHWTYAQKLTVASYTTSKINVNETNKQPMDCDHQLANMPIRAHFVRRTISTQKVGYSDLQTDLNTLAKR